MGNAEKFDAKKECSLTAEEDDGAVEKELRSSYAAYARAGGKVNHTTSVGKERSCEVKASAAPSSDFLSEQRLINMASVTSW